MSPTPDSSSDDPQQVIADLQRQLASRTSERDAALAREAAATEVLQVINASPGDLTPVFDAILEKSHTLCGAVQGAMFLFDGEHLRAVATRNMPEAFNSRMRAGYRAADFPLTQALLAGKSFNHVEDIALLDHPVARAAAELTGARTVLAVALRKGDALLGQIVAARREVRPFGNEQIALLQNFAVQAVIAMENARLLREMREALEQQTGTTEILSVINNSPGELNPVFDAMLDRALRLCEGAFGSLFTFDGEFFHQAAARNRKVAVDRPFRPTPKSAAGELVRGERFVHVADARDSEAYRSGDPSRVRLVENEGARSYLAVPMRKGETLLGLIAIYRQEVRPFSEKQIALLENFAAQAVIAMENARLLIETREALEQQTATAEVLGVINSSPGDLAPVFDAILEKAHKLCGAARGALALYDGESFRAVAIHGYPEEVAEEIRRPYGANVFFQRIVDGDRYVQIPDFQAVSAQLGDPVGRAALDHLDLRTWLAVPLRKEGVLLGYISAVRSEVRPFSDKEIALIENFAAQAVIAMENARLITETREALEQQTATAEVLGVINASPGDLAPVFKAILEKAHTLCGVAHGSLQLYDDGKFRAVAVHGLPEALAERLMEGYSPNPSLPNYKLLEGAPFAQIADLGEIDLPMAQEVVKLGGTRTHLLVALRKENTLLGQIVAARKEVRLFSDKEIALLQNFAAQAVIAMENARLLDELRQRNDEIAGWNRELEDRVAAQLGELERVGKLKRFLAPQLAELIVTRGDEAVLETHRRDIVVVFCDLRDFTAFAETAEPEEVLDLLREYHAALGPIVSASEGTLDHFSGDGIMVFFNDPLPIPDASERAVRMAIAMREAMAGLQAQWRRQGRRVGFGVGIARGYATLGQIGFADRIDYTAIGTVCNLAARLCAEAKDGQILLSQRVATAVEGTMPLDAIGEVALKGLSQPVAVYNVPPAGAQAALRVIEGGTPTA